MDSDAEVDIESLVDVTDDGVFRAPSSKTMDLTGKNVVGTRACESIL